jgi:hypothetical protein
MGDLHLFETKALPNLIISKHFIEHLKKLSDIYMLITK